MQLKINLTESNSKIEKKILQALVVECDKLFSQAAPKIEPALRPIVRDAIYNSPTMDSLRSGVLRYDFGLNFDPSAAIADAVASSIQVKTTSVKLNGRKLSGGITVNIQPSSLFNLLSLPQAVVITEKNDKLPWLEWLTMYGNQIIIADFGVEYGAGLGRSGGGHMVTKERPFQVHSSFAGTQDDNFIVHVLNSRISVIQNAIGKVLL